MNTALALTGVILLLPAFVMGMLDVSLMPRQRRGVKSIPRVLWVLFFFAAVALIIAGIWVRS